ncbi:hypothetical protein SEA_RABINOVISH_100 [Mycobacterium phage Rabinovish]|nr:hypothetical protein SEA_RABINOVISH_100 [Mycobacterium phage Rabinovish]
MTLPGPPNTPPGADSPAWPPVVSANGYVPPESIPTRTTVTSVEGRSGDVDVTMGDIEGLQEALDEASAPATWDTLSGKPAVIAAGATQAAARSAIGAGTSSLALGTTSTTAKAGDYQPTWAQVTGKPAVIAAGADAAEARTAIGAGTSNLALGTTASTALAGNTALVPPTRTVNGKALSANVTLGGGDVALTGYAAGTAEPVSATDTVNAAIAKLEARIAALEAGQP